MGIPWSPRGVQRCFRGQHRGVVGEDLEWGGGTGWAGAWLPVCVSTGATSLGAGFCMSLSPIRS